MKVIVDTNVVISGIFFSGPPYEILNAWRNKRLQIVFSPVILDEYQRVGKELGKQFPKIDTEPFMELLMIEGHLIVPIIYIRKHSKTKLNGHCSVLQVM